MWKVLPEPVCETESYGDVYPVTEIGKLLASIIAILGIGLFALPAGLLGAAFIEERTSRDEGTKTCPHCGAQTTDEMA